MLQNVLVIPLHYTTCTAVQLYTYWLPTTSLHFDFMPLRGCGYCLFFYLFCVVVVVLEQSESVSQIFLVDHCHHYLSTLGIV